jgi:hypothetical protein
MNPGRQRTETPSKPIKRGNTASARTGSGVFFGQRVNNMDKPPPEMTPDPVRPPRARPPAPPATATVRAPTAPRIPAPRSTSPSKPAPASPSWPRAHPAHPPSAASNSPPSKATPPVATTAAPSPSATATATSATTAEIAWGTRDRYAAKYACGAWLRSALRGVYATRHVYDQRLWDPVL